MRGEKSGFTLQNQPLMGSPPHARGKVRNNMFSKRIIRITPACAGKRDCILISILRHQDHPRMRGEKQYTGARYVPLVGSPPHARGKDFHISTSLPPYRITPACAGKSVYVQINFLTVQDHPRMRGEKSNARKRMSVAIGSPPHARGKGRKAW